MLKFVDSSPTDFSAVCDVCLCQKRPSAEPPVSRRTPFANVCAAAMRRGKPRRLESNVRYITSARLATTQIVSRSQFFNHVAPSHTLAMLSHNRFCHQLRKSNKLSGLRIVRACAHTTTNSPDAPAPQASSVYSPISIIAIGPGVNFWRTACPE